MIELMRRDASTEIPCRMEGYLAVMAITTEAHVHTPATLDTIYTERTAEEVPVTPAISGATETHKDGCHQHQLAETSMSVRPTMVVVLMELALTHQALSVATAFLDGPVDCVTKTSTNVRSLMEVV